MISEARLRTLAREQSSGVGLTEKDYVNSWILRAIFTTRLKDNWVFKGGTALSKIHFPERWRFSEDLDFTFRGSDFDEFNHLQDILRKGLGRVSEESGIEFEIRSFHKNSEYAQIKVQYDAILQQKNTTSLDVFGGEEIYFSVQSIDHSFEDIPEFVIQVYQN
jgi:predicted nucleotidyltransferase component of viral defense system